MIHEQHLYTLGSYSLILPIRILSFKTDHISVEFVIIFLRREGVKVFNKLSDLCKIKDLKENVQQDNKLDLQLAGSSPYLTYTKISALNNNNNNMY